MVFIMDNFLVLRSKQDSWNQDRCSNPKYFSFDNLFDTWNWDLYGHWDPGSSGKGVPVRTAGTVETLSTVSPREQLVHLSCSEL